MRRARLTASATLALALLAATPVAGQQPGRVFRIDILGNVPLTDPEGARLWGAFTQGLRELGYLEGQSITIEHAARQRRAVTPPLWLDAQGQPRPTRACRTCGREVAPMRFRAADLRPHGWAPGQTLHVPDWCGCTTECLPVPDGANWWRLVPIWEAGQTLSPLRRDEPAVPR